MSSMAVRFDFEPSAIPRLHDRCEVRRYKPSIIFYIVIRLQQCKPFVSSRSRQLYRLLMFEFPRRTIGRPKTKVRLRWKTCRGYTYRGALVARLYSPRAEGS